MGPIPAKKGNSPPRFRHERSDFFGTREKPGLDRGTKTYNLHRSIYQMSHRVQHSTAIHILGRPCQHFPRAESFCSWPTNRCHFVPVLSSHSVLRCSLVNKSQSWSRTSENARWDNQNIMHSWTKLHTRASNKYILRIWLRPGARYPPPRPPKFYLHRTSLGEGGGGQDTKYTLPLPSHLSHTSLSRPLLYTDKRGWCLPYSKLRSDPCMCIHRKRQKSRRCWKQQMVCC